MKISIITINWNNATGLEKTIKSVVEQTYKNIEYIVIDGASTDNSVEIIKKYETSLSYWVSEPDNGIYNAMNKGTQKATGDYCLFLNSGDKLIEPNIIKTITDKYQFTKDIISCDLLSCRDNIINYKSAPENNYISLDFVTTNPIPHPSTFIRTNLIKKYPYDETLKIAGDFVFFFDMLVIKRTTYQHINKALSIFYKDGISSKNGNSIGIKEGYDFISQHINTSILNELRDRKDSKRNELIHYVRLLSKKHYKTMLYIFKLILKIHNLITEAEQIFYTYKYKKHI